MVGFVGRILRIRNKCVGVKGEVLHNAVSSPQECSKRFTLYLIPPMWAQKRFGQPEVGTPLRVFATLLDPRC